MSLQFGTDGAASAAPSPPPGRTECLLIGAAEEPDMGGLGVDATLKRLRDSVKNDLGKMIEFCAKWAKDEPPTKMAKTSSRTPSLPVHSKAQASLKCPVVITTIIVSNNTLVPGSDDTGIPLSAKAKTFMQSCRPKLLVYQNKEQVRDAVRNFTKRSSCDNLIIFYAGHGVQQEIKAGKVVEEDNDKPCKKGSQESAASKLMEVREKVVKEIQHSLYLPCPRFPHQDLLIEYYDLYPDHEFTSDVTVHLEPSQNMYLVLHACNSGGMFHGWQLRADQRLRGPETSLSVAVFASSEAENVSDWTSLGGDADFVSIFTEFAKPGKKLIEIQSDIFKASVQRNRDRKPGVSPALIVLRPDQRDELFLPK